MDGDVKMTEDPKKDFLLPGWYHDNAIIFSTNVNEKLKVARLMEDSPMMLHRSCSVLLGRARRGLESFVGYRRKWWNVRRECYFESKRGQYCWRNSPHLMSNGFWSRRRLLFFIFSGIRVDSNILNFWWNGPSNGPLNVIFSLYILGKSIKVPRGEFHGSSSYTRYVLFTPLSSSRPDTEVQFHPSEHISNLPGTISKAAPRNLAI